MGKVFDQGKYTSFDALPERFQDAFKLSLTQHGFPEEGVFKKSIGTLLVRAMNVFPSLIFPSSFHREKLVGVDTREKDVDKKSVDSVFRKIEFEKYYLFQEMLA